jgi:hypothetical protein
MRQAHVALIKSGAKVASIVCHGTEPCVAAVVLADPSVAVAVAAMFEELSALASACTKLVAPVCGQLEPIGESPWLAASAPSA